MIKKLQPVFMIKNIGINQEFNYTYAPKYTKAIVKFLW